MPLSKIDQIKAAKARLQKLEDELSKEESVKKSIGKIRKYVESLNLDWIDFLKVAKSEIPSAPRKNYTKEDHAAWDKLAKEGKTASEIATALGVKLNTIAQHLKNAKA
jgi:hypothetical protein